MAVKIGKVNKKILRKFGRFGNVVAKFGKIGLSTGAIIGLIAPEFGLPMAGAGGLMVGAAEGIKTIGKL